MPGGEGERRDSFKVLNRQIAPMCRSISRRGLMAHLLHGRGSLSSPAPPPLLSVILGEFATLIPSAISPFLNRHLAPAFSLSQLVELNFYPEYARDVRQTFSRGCTERCSLANLSTSENAPGREICKPFMMEQFFETPRLRRPI